MTQTQQPPLAAEPSPIAFRGWQVLIAAVGCNLILGALYSWGVIAKALAAQGWSRTGTAWPFTASTICFALMMIFAGRLQDKIGPRLIVTLGGIVFGLGLVASSFATSPVLMLITFGVIGGLGIGLGYSATTPPAVKWFPPGRKGLVTGVVVSGVGLSAVYMAPLTQYLLGEAKMPDISRTLLILGIGAIVLITLMAQFIKNPPAGYSPKASAPKGGGQAKAAPIVGRDLDWNGMLKTGQFYRLWAMFILSASAGLMIIMHIALIAKEQAGWKWGFLPVGILAIFNTLGRVVSGFLSDRIGRTQTMVLAFTLQAVNMFLFVHYTTAELVVFGAAFTGLCYGTIFTLMPAATADAYGLKNLGVNYGLVFTGFGVAGAVGPLLAGEIHDTTHSYSLAYIIAAIMLLIGAVLAATARRPAKPVEAAKAS